LIAELGKSAEDPLPLAESLVKWANEQGGKDNIGVALARH
jgi:serine/threonine protein phosphatase PrpC